MKRLHSRPLWALALAAGVGCAPAAKTPADFAPLTVSERAVEVSVATVVFPREDQTFDVAALEPAVRDAVARVRGRPVTTPIEYVDDTDFIARTRPALEKMYTSKELVFTNRFIEREWVAVGEADRIVARREVRGVFWSPRLVASLLATALVESSLDVREADLPEFHQLFKHGVARFYGDAAASVIAGMPPHRALFRVSLEREFMGHGFESPYFGPGSNVSDAGVAARASAERFWEEAARDFAHALYTLGGNRLVEAALIDPPTTLRELSVLEAYASGAPPSTLRRNDGGAFAAIGPTVTAGLFGVARLAGSVAGGGGASGPQGAKPMVVVAEFYREALPDTANLVKGGFIRTKTLPSGNALVAFSNESAADAEAVLAVMESTPGPRRRRWNYAPNVILRTSAHEACAYGRVGGKYHSACSDTEYSSESKGFSALFRGVSPVDTTAVALRLFAYSDSEGKVPPLLAEGARTVRMRRTEPALDTRLTAICGGTAVAVVVDGVSCDGDACKEIVKATTATLGVPPPEDVPTFCAELAYEQAHDLPEPQIPPGLLVARP